jgi:hypothetical protein
MQGYQYLLKQQILSMLDKHEKNKLYYLHMDIYNSYFELLKKEIQKKDNSQYYEMIEDLQKIFPNYIITKEYINADAILNKQVENYINFFEKHKNKEDSLFATLAEIIKIFK